MDRNFAFHCGEVVPAGDRSTGKCARYQLVFFWGGGGNISLQTFCFFSMLEQYEQGASSLPRAFEGNVSYHK